MTVREPALAPSPEAVSLLFPVADSALDDADSSALAAMPRTLPLVYVGNQYDRDAAFSDFFASSATWRSHRVAGKWPHVSQWPHVTARVFSIRRVPTGRSPARHCGRLALGGGEDQAGED